MNFKYVDINNLDKLREPAITFEREGRYCPHAPGTSAFLKYWKEQESRCLYGYKVGNDYISGYNYFYWNFSRIQVVKSYIDNFGVDREDRFEAFPDPRDYDKYFFDYVEEAERSGNHVVVFKARGKGYEQPISEPVATPDGFTRFGNLRVGDLVLNPDGGSTKVLEIYDQGMKDVLEVSFDDGRKVRCGYDHLWRVSDKFHSGKSVVLTTYDMMKNGLFRAYSGYNHYRYYIEPIKEVIYEKREYDIHPYILGALLGDGSMNKGSIKISTTDAEIVENFQTLLGEDYNLVRDYSCVNYRINYKKRFDTKEKEKFENGKYGVNPLRRYILDLDLNVKHLNKYIPDIYKYGSIEDRYELVRGLMDTDGYVSTEGAIEFTNTSKRLVDDLAEVLRSLGIRCEIGTDKREGKFAYRLYIRTSKPIFKLKRKLDRLNLSKKVTSKVAIIGITNLGYREKSMCILVDNPNHMYLTKDYVPTHNSFKGASMMNRNYFLLRNSKSYAFASSTQYLTGDGILVKAWEIMDFIDNNTAWGKRRSFKNTDMHKRASYQESIDGIKTEVGYKSEIIGVSVDNPNKVRGKRGKLILYEEAGSFRDLLKAYQISRPSVEAGNKTFGLIIVFGTGGDENLADAMGLEELFFNPKGYRIQPIDNIWSEGTTGKSGFFVPIWANLDGFYNEKTGISDKDAALKFHEAEYAQILKNAKDSKTAIRYKAENCVTPEDAVLRVTGSIFPTNYLKQRLAEVTANKEIEDSEYVGELVYIDDKVTFKVNKDKIPIRNFPTGTDKPEGAVTIWELPVTNSDGIIPYGVYIAGTDPYADDESGTDSLGSTFVMNVLTNRIVAEYTGRPATAKEYYENVLRLLKFYNAQCNYEQNVKGMFAYFEQKNSLYYLADTPRILRDMDIQKAQGGGNKSKGTTATEGVNKYARELIKGWMLDTAYGCDNKTNLYTIKSIPLLKEAIYWNKDGNFDRISSLGMLLILKEDRAKFADDLTKPIKTINDDPFFDKIYQKKAMFKNQQNAGIYLPNNHSRNNFAALLKNA